MYNFFQFQFSREIKDINFIFSSKNRILDKIVYICKITAVIRMNIRKNILHKLRKVCTLDNRCSINI